MTLPKGQLPPTSAEAREGNSPVPGGGHVLIIPVRLLFRLSTVLA